MKNILYCALLLGVVIFTGIVNASEVVLRDEVLPGAV
jgi:hypothetical protein